MGTEITSILHLPKLLIHILKLNYRPSQGSQKIFGYMGLPRQLAPVAWQVAKTGLKGKEFSTSLSFVEAARRGLPQDWESDDCQQVWYWCIKYFRTLALQKLPTHFPPIPFPNILFILPSTTCHTH